MYEKQIETNQAKYYTQTQQRIFKEIGFKGTEWNVEAIGLLIAWQKENNVDTGMDFGFCGPKTMKAMERQWSDEAREELPGQLSEVFFPKDTSPKITKTLQKLMIDFTMKFEGGIHSPYSACNCDGEWRGLFDRPKNLDIPKRPDKHWASRYNSDGGTHIGLSWGAWQFTQDGGALGRVLTEAQATSPVDFEADFGGPGVSSALLAMCQKKGRDRVRGSDGGARSCRVQKLGGMDLWEGIWLERFRAAGKKPYAQAAQRAIAVIKYLTPAVKLAQIAGINKLNEIAVMFDIAIQFGDGGLASRLDRAKRAGGGLLIEKLIRQLPENRQERRRSILKAAPSITFESYEIE